MANQFILSDPDLDFALRDGGPNQDFDGVADEIFPEFGTIILGIDRDIPFQSLGEGRSIVEFDLSSFVVPDGEAIAEVRLELELSNTQVAGLGQDGSNIPNALSLYGYTGNGHADLTDFDAGTFIDSIDSSAVTVGDTSPEQVNQLLSIDMTSLVRSLVRESESFVGFGIRTDEVGGIRLRGPSTLDSPKLVIRTEEPTSTDYLVTTLNESGAGSLRQAILNANSFVGADTIRSIVGRSNDYPWRT